MADCYEVAFSSLLDLVRDRKTHHEKYYKSIENSIGYVINLGDKNYSDYVSMVESNEISAASTIESLAVQLLTESDYPGFSLYPVASYREKAPFKSVIATEGKKTGFLFSVSSDIGKHYDAFKRKLYSVDELVVVRLIDPDKEGYEALIARPNKMNKDSDLLLRYMTLREFWSEHFGENEYAALENAINDFNMQAQEIIGFNTVVTPSEEAIKHFRVTSGKILQEYPYADFISTDVYQEQINKMLHNYVVRGLWKAMIGNCNFAISYITSEWYYKMHQLTESFDLTWVAAGYLKSVEQLLYAVIELSKGKGIIGRSKDWRNQNGIAFTKDNEENIDVTLGGLEWVIKNNHLLEVNRYARSYITSTIDDWRFKSRNGYFHKDVIKTVAQVDEIRSAAIQLYFLILGSFTIQDDQFAQLGIE